jgi:peptidyl-prolyl cis-trans isomerase C
MLVTALVTAPVTALATVPLRARRFVGCLGAILAISLCVSGRSDAAMSAEEKARRAVVVARVGTREITTGELEDRIAQVPHFQLATFGTTPDAVRRKFLDEVVVPEALYAEEAHDEHLDAHYPASELVKRKYADSVLRAIRADLGPAAAISMDDVRAYYEENKSRYDTPERYNVWRILCKTREEAVAVIEAAKKDLTIANFNNLARDHSIDKATNQRGGNVGFLALDGSSNEAGVRVDPAVAKAAAGVKDGELVGQPVPEGSGFAVVWHRGTVPAVKRPVEEAAAQIRDTLRKHREELAVKKVIADLRARDLHELNEGLLNGIEVSSVDGAIEPRRRPGQTAPLNPSQSLPR